MWRAISGLVAGLVFGLGLVISGMSNPAKVLNFLDLAGAWDPSLAFVMGGALVVTFVGYRLVQRSSAPLLDTTFHIPAKAAIDLRLLVGSGLFGIGWGIGGYCPGPALASSTLGDWSTWAFLVSMLVGMLLARQLFSLFESGAAKATH